MKSLFGMTMCLRRDPFPLDSYDSIGICTIPETWLFECTPIGPPLTVDDEAQILQSVVPRHVDVLQFHHYDSSDEIRHEMMKAWTLCGIISTRGILVRTQLISLNVGANQLMRELEEMHQTFALINNLSNGYYSYG